MSTDQNGYNKSGMIVFVLSMLASFGIMIYVAFLSGGIDLKEVRERAGGPQQQAAAGAAAGGAGAVDVSAVKDPWMPSDQMVARGKQLFAQNCAMCHGNEGKGDGPAGMSLNPRPRNFVEGKWKKGGTRLGLMGVLQNGLPPSSMQSYKHLPINDRWALIHFIRSITQNLVKDSDADVAAKAPSLQ
jgi:mono/diheme cytochrome c family protein